MTQVFFKAGSETALKKQLDPDLHFEEQLDPDPQKIIADLQPCLTVISWFQIAFGLHQDPDVIGFTNEDLKQPKMF